MITLKVFLNIFPESSPSTTTTTTTTTTLSPGETHVVLTIFTFGWEKLDILTSGLENHWCSVETISLITAYYCSNVPSAYYIILSSSFFPCTVFFQFFSTFLLILLLCLPLLPLQIILFYFILHCSNVTSISTSLFVAFIVWEIV